jgi:FixJ family two-component response regulator
MRTRALKAGAVEFLSKPFGDKTLLKSIRVALGSLAGKEKVLPAGLGSDSCAE